MILKWLIMRKLELFKESFEMRKLVVISCNLW